MEWVLPVAAFLPPAMMLYSVAKQSKTFAALMQSRLTDAPVVKHVDSDRLIRSLKVLDKLIYTLGVVNLALSSYLFGAVPTLYYLWHTPKTVLLTIIRWMDFREKGQHYLLYDFCYWANAFLLLNLWAYPRSATMFQVSWCLANGPLAWSTLTFSHSMIFHSYPHLTSVIIHFSPAMVVHGIRFYQSDAFTVCDDFPQCSGANPLRMVWDSLRYFYLWWIVLYYLWVFVLMADRCKQRGYQTLFDRVIKGPGKFLAKIHPHHMVQKTAYAMVHLIFGTVTMFLAALMWYSYVAHFIFVFAILGTVSYNAASWYFGVFLVTYQHQLEEKAKEIETRRSRSPLASPTKDS